MKLFYIGIAYGEYPEKNKKTGRMAAGKDAALSIERLEREFPYLLGEGRNRKEKLQIYFSLLPEYSGKSFWRKKETSWKPERKVKLLQDAAKYACRELDCDEVLLADTLTEEMDVEETGAIPEELWAVCLYRQRPFDKISILLPAEENDALLQQVKRLLAPYLPRIRQVTCRGMESSLSLQLADYLYGEFGIIMRESEELTEGMLYLNFGREPGGQEPVSCGYKKIKYLNSMEVMKFLDTMVKNGYNTKVN